MLDAGGKSEAVAEIVQKSQIRVTPDPGRDPACDSACPESVGSGGSLLRQPDSGDEQKRYIPGDS